MATETTTTTTTTKKELVPCYNCTGRNIRNIGYWCKLCEFPNGEGCGYLYKENSTKPITVYWRYDTGEILSETFTPPEY